MSHADRREVPCASAMKCSSNGKLVKDEEFVLHFTNVSCQPVGLELCTRGGHAVAYTSSKNTHPSASEHQFTLDSRTAASNRSCVHVMEPMEVSAKCTRKLGDLYASVQGVGRLNHFELLLSQNASEGVILFFLLHKHREQRCEGNRKSTVYKRSGDI